MPRLIFEGDVRNSLGDKFPTVYFTNISVFDDRIELQLNSFVEDVVLEELVEDLNVYVVPIYKRGAYESVISNPNNLIQELYSIGLGNSPTFIEPPAGGRPTVPMPSGPSGGGFRIGTNYFQPFLMKIDPNAVVETRNYNANNNQYLKLIFMKTFGGFTETLEKLDFVSFVAFTSFLSPEDLQGFIDSGNFSSISLDQVSIISHTKTVESRLVVNETFNSYLLDGQNYYGKVIQDLNNGYRVNNEQQFATLRSQLIQTNNRFTGTGDEQLQSFVDSFSYIVATQTLEVDFLKQIKSVLDSFPSRTSTSPIGIYYNSIKDLVFAFNDYLLTQPRLEVRLINTLHNFDFRQASVFDLAETNRAPYNDFYNLRNSPLSRYNEEFIYNPYMDRTRRIPVQLFEDEEGDVGDIIDENAGVVYNHSYFLFDYEKALYKTSNISQIFNVDEIIMYFGENCLSPYFQFSSVSYGRLHPGASPNTQVFGCGIGGAFNNFNFNDTNRGPTPDLTFNLLINSDYSSFEVPDSAPAKAGRERLQVLQENATRSRQNELLNSFIAQRNIDVFESIGDYKLACFEVSDIQQPAIIETAYRMGVKINDYTCNFVIDRIIQPALSALAGLRDYYDHASDFCSYNDLDNRFNDFFVEFINERYSAAEKPPWELGPIWFNIITNLLTRTRIEQASQIIYNSIISEVIKISPETGNLDNIALFIQRLEDLLSTFEEGGEIHELIYGGSNADGTRAGNGLIDNVQITFSRKFEDLPPILDDNQLVYEREYELEQFRRNQRAMLGEFDIRAYSRLQTRNSNSALKTIFRLLHDIQGTLQQDIVEDEKIRYAIEFLEKWQNAIKTLVRLETI